MSPSGVNRADRSVAYRDSELASFVIGFKRIPVVPPRTHHETGRANGSYVDESLYRSFNSRRGNHHG